MPDSVKFELVASVVVLALLSCLNNMSDSESLVASVDTDEWNYISGETNIRKNYQEPEVEYDENRRRATWN